MNRNNYGHTQIRVPDGWSGQSKMLIIQLNNVLDDIYRQVNSLRKKIEELEQGDESDVNEND